VWCDLGLLAASAGPDASRVGDGWTLLLKTGGAGDAFAYDSEHWTRATTLNPEALSARTGGHGRERGRRSHDRGRGAADAKFDAFNRLRVRELAALWPSLDAGPARVWTTPPFSNTTALAYFQTPRTFADAGLVAQPWWDEAWHSRQGDGPGQNAGSQKSPRGYVEQYGIAVETRATAARWGYAFNDGEAWDTSEGDVVGGVGLRAPGRADWTSAGDAARGGAEAQRLRRAPLGDGARPVLIFGRTGGAETERRAAEAEAAAEAERLNAAERAAVAARQSDDEAVGAQIDCGTSMSCDACAAIDGCAWCLGQRLCVEDIPWICHGEKYHVSHPEGKNASGPGKARCPTEAERAEDRRKREERVRRMEEQEAARERRAQERRLRAAQRAAREAAGTPSDAPGAGAESGNPQEEGDLEENDSPEMREARERARERRHAAALEELARIREELGIEDDAPEEESGTGPTEEEIAHLEEMAQRAEAAELESGATRPYEVLGLERDCSQTEVRRAYRRLSLRFHPDKNRGAKDAHRAFEDIVAAYEVIGTPDKRAAFDEAAGESGTSEDFDARWESGKFSFDSDLYAGDRLVTTLTEKLWERRLIGDSIWLIECYAAWCPACKNFVPHWRETAKLMKDDDVEVGAVNCEKQRTICGPWFDVASYPSIVMINRKHGMVQRYRKKERKPEEIREWAKTIADEWTYLFHASNVTTIEAPAFRRTVLEDEKSMWIVMFSDGLACAQCRTAKTNMMRLSSGLHGLPIRIGIVDCERPESRGLCYGKGDDAADGPDGGATEQISMGLPDPPHRPQCRAWGAGEKKEGDLGELLYNVNMLEPHVALRLVEKVARLALRDQMDPEVAAAQAQALVKGSQHRGAFEDEDEDEDEEDDAPPAPSPGLRRDMFWDGPPQRHKPLPWAGMSRPNGLPALTRG
jgi:thiol-disulfide isomerase/thioredoxin